MTRHQKPRVQADVRTNGDSARRFLYRFKHWIKQRDSTTVS
jgi:hypothetical protein